MIARLVCKNTRRIPHLPTLLVYIDSHTNLISNSILDIIFNDKVGRGDRCTCVKSLFT